MDTDKNVPPPPPNHMHVPLHKTTRVTLVEVLRRSHTSRSLALSFLWSIMDCREVPQTSGPLLIKRMCPNLLSNCFFRRGRGRNYRSYKDFPGLFFVIILFTVSGGICLNSDMFVVGFFCFAKLVYIAREMKDGYFRCCIL